MRVILIVIGNTLELFSGKILNYEKCKPTYSVHGENGAVLPT